MYVHIYGSSAPLHYMVRIRKYEELYIHSLSLISHAQSTHMKKREEEAMCERPGSEKWTIPTPILNEEEWRREIETREEEDE